VKAGRNGQFDRKDYFMLRIKAFRSALGMTGLAMLILLSGLCSQAGSGQTKREALETHDKAVAESPKGKNARDHVDDKVDLQIIRLKYVRAAELANTLSTILPLPNGKQNDAPPLLRLAVDPQSNSLLVSASPPILKEINALVPLLDIQTAAAADDSQRLVTFPLQKLAGDQTLQAALSMILQKSPKSKYTLDPRRNTLLLYADEKAQAEVSELIRALSAIAEAPKKAPPSPAPAMQIRVLWLVDDPSAAELTGDATKLVPVLTKLGIKNPRLASNLLVNVKSGSFQISGKSAYGNGAVVRITGICRFENDRPGAKIDIRVDSEPKTGANTKASLLSSIETEIQAPFGHFVVLGMTPTQDVTSVFAVQINEAN
jgi:hypothetical protein